jgi:pimeloyl-ACP methyl ester carboxylesterase
LPLQCSIDSDAPARGAQRIRVMSQRLSHWVSDRYFPSPTSALHRLVTGGAIVTATLIASAIFNRVAVKRAERDNPAVGKFVDVGALRLHYVERGTGEPLVLLHGNSGMIQDFTSSGLVEKAAERYRVIVFDRPGFGYSSRPRRTIWTAEAQAYALHDALEQIGISHAIILGHSWGASVAVSLALKYPAFVSALVLASGYFYPSFRADVVVLSGPSLPGIGDIMCHTVSPILGRILRPLFMRKLFGPAPVPRKFEGFPKEMALRPSQIRASATETALMIPDAFTLSERYAELKMPVAIVAGEGDRMIDIDRQSARLHNDIANSTLYRIPDAGHMVHQTATEAVMAAIDQSADESRIGNSVRASRHRMEV